MTSTLNPQHEELSLKENDEKIDINFESNIKEQIFLNRESVRRMNLDLSSKNANFDYTQYSYERLVPILNSKFNLSFSEDEYKKYHTGELLRLFSFDSFMDISHQYFKINKFEDFYKISQILNFSKTPKMVRGVMSLIEEIPPYFIRNIQSLILLQGAGDKIDLDLFEVKKGGSSNVLRSLSQETPQFLSFLHEVQSKTSLNVISYLTDSYEEREVRFLNLKSWFENRKIFNLAISNKIFKNNKFPFYDDVKSDVFIESLKDLTLPNLINKEVLKQVFANSHGEITETLSSKEDFFIWMKNFYKSSKEETSPLLEEVFDELNCKKVENKERLSNIDFVNNKQQNYLNDNGVSHSKEIISQKRTLVLYCRHHQINAIDFAIFAKSAYKYIKLGYSKVFNDLSIVSIQPQKYHKGAIDKIRYENKRGNDFVEVSSIGANVVHFSHGMPQENDYGSIPILSAAVRGDKMKMKNTKDFVSMHLKIDPRDEIDTPNNEILYDGNMKSMSKEFLRSIIELENKLLSFK